MNKNSNSHFVLALTGPAASGKSTIGEKLAKHYKKCVNIDADSVKHMVVSGFHVNHNNPENREKWEFSEWSLVGESIGLLVKNFLSHGFDIIINGYIDQSGWNEIEKLISINYKVLLLPNTKTLIERDKNRYDDLRQGEFTVKKHHQYFSGNQYYKDFYVINTSNHSIEDTVKALQNVLGPTK